MSNGRGAVGKKVNTKNSREQSERLGQSNKMQTHFFILFRDSNSVTADHVVSALCRMRRKGKSQQNEGQDNLL
jgi:hypothetical protein